MSWRPLLEGSLRAEALAAARHILDELPTPNDISALGPGLAGGDAGLAVVAAYAGRTGGHPYAGAARGFLDRAIEGATSEGLSLFEGLVGVGWASSHLHELGVADAAASLERALAERLEEPWTRDYDLVAGLVGFGVFALERLPSPEARRLLAAVLRQLGERADPVEGGTAWSSRAAWVPLSVRDRHPDGLLNVGLAHGVPGAVGLLAAARAAGIEPTAVLEDAVRWLRGQALDPGGASCYPRWVVDGTPEPARTAWCYGDPGVAAAMLLAGRATGTAGLEAEALWLGREVAGRDPAAGRVEDAGICHGSAGVLHVLGRLASATGDADLRRGVERWAARVVEERRPGSGIGGYRSLVPDDAGEMGWRDDPSLLTGAGGIALALLGVAGEVAPDWDRFLLVSAATVDLARREPAIA